MYWKEAVVDEIVGQIRKAAWVVLMVGMVGILYLVLLDEKFLRGAEGVNVSQWITNAIVRLHDHHLIMVVELALIIGYLHVLVHGVSHARKLLKECHRP